MTRIYLYNPIEIVGFKKTIYYLIDNSLFTLLPKLVSDLILLKKLLNKIINEFDTDYI